MSGTEPVELSGSIEEGEEDFDISDTFVQDDCKDEDVGEVEEERSMQIVPYTLGAANLGLAGSISHRVLAQWSEMPAQWSEMPVQWSEMLAQWSEMPAQWSEMLAQWSEMLAQWSEMPVPRLLTSPLCSYRPLGSSFTFVGPPIVKSVEIRVGGEVWQKLGWCENCQILHGQGETCVIYQAAKEMWASPPQQLVLQDQES